MRILTLGSVPSRWGARSDGGVAEVHAVIASRMAEAPPAPVTEFVGLVAPNRDRESALAPPAGIPVFDLPPESREQRAWYLRLLEREKPDAVLFFHIAHRFAQWHATHAPDVPSVGAIHSWTPIVAAPPERRAKATEAMHRTLAGMHSLVFVSAHCRDEGLALGFEYGRKDHVIPNPLQPCFLRRDVLLSSRGSRPRIIFVGALEERKRPGLLIDAARELDCEVVFIGAGSLRSALQQRVHDLAMTDRVRFCGAIAPEAVAEEMLHADVLCNPSASESFGLIYTEALACGLPVVGFAPAIDEIADLCRMSIGEGLPGDATGRDLSAALRRVLAGSWDRAALAKACKARFSPDRIVTEYARIIGTTATHLNPGDKMEGGNGRVT